MAAMSSRVRIPHSLQLPFSKIAPYLLKSIGKFLFNNRSYTPLPFILLMIIFMNPVLNLMIIGFLVALSGELFRIWAVSYIGSESRTTTGVGGSNLVTQGPYSLMRNPLYLGNIMLYVGIGIMSNALFPWLPIIAFLYFIFQYYVIIINEEEYLHQTFKENFEIYCKSVGRFIPWFNKIPGEIKSKLMFNLAAGLKSDRRSIQAFVFVTSLILIFYFFDLRIYTHFF